MTVVTSEIEARIRAGERLDEAALRQVAAIDVLTLGMLADEARKRLHGSEATFVRVCEVDAGQDWTTATLPSGAGELRLRGLPSTLAETVEMVSHARAAAGARLLSGFSLADLEERSQQGWGTLPDMLGALRNAGLDALADAPVDRLDLQGAWLDAVRESGVLLPRLTVDGTLGPDRVSVLMAIRKLQECGAGFLAMAPLPRTVSVAAPTTGYDDVRAVALARIALDNVASIQVDWQHYGPKLAQVALTFGADDMDNVLAEEDPARGWRRAPAEEVRRNIAAAGLQPIERDGRFEKRPS